MEDTLTLIIIAIIIAVIIALLIWALMNYQLLQSKAAAISYNPYAIRYTCADKPPPELLIEEDPQKRAYQSINYCIVNGPPATLNDALASCRSGVIVPQVSNQLKELGKFYNDEYIKTCGYTWKTSSSIPVDPNNPEAANPQNPENPNGNILNGTNDPFIVNLVGCADHFPDLENDPYLGINGSLRKICGSSCN